MKKTLIFGGAGFIGYHLSKHLSDQGHEVTIVDNFKRSAEDKEFKELISRNNVEFIKASILDKKTFENLDTDYDYVYHLCAINGTQNFYKIPVQVLKVGTVGTLNILDWFVKCKKGKILFSSSSETYGGLLKILNDKFKIPTPEEVPLVVNDPSNVRWSYGGSKILGEVAFHAYSQEHDLKKYVIIRYHNIYGPRMGYDHVIPQFIQRIVNKESPFKVYGGQETRTFCYVDDAVRATQLVMETDSTNQGTINIGRSDDEIKILDMLNKLFSIVNYKPPLDIQSAPAGSVMRRCPDTSKLQKIGFNPEVPLSKGLEICYDWYKDKFD